MVTIVLDNDQAVPLGNEPVLLNDKIIGQTTSASFGYRIGKPLALAYLKRDLMADMNEKKVHVDIAGRLFAGYVIRNAAFEPSGKRMRTFQDIFDPI